jgi:STE24 endopeptidase
MDLSAVQIPVNAPGVVEFNQQRDALWLLLQAAVIAVPASILWSGLAARWRDAMARAAGGRATLAWVLFAALFLTVWTAAVTPFAYLLEVAHRSAWGRPTDDVEIWLANRGLMLGALILGAAVLAGPLLWLQRRFPRGWWVIASAAVWMAVSTGLIVEQVWVRPMLTPVAALEAGPVKAKFDILAARCVATPVPVFVGGVDSGGSVVGAGPFRRLLMAPAEIVAARTSKEGEAETIGTMAHELAHYVFHDPELALFTVGGLIFATALATMLLGRLCFAVWGVRLGFRDLGDPAAVPLLLMLGTVVWTFLAAPVLLAVQRHVELRADKFALEMTRDNAARLRVLLREAGESPLRVHDYYWFLETFRATHPSHAARVRLAMTYRPWDSGATGVADRVCAPD